MKKEPTHDKIKPSSMSKRNLPDIIDFAKGNPASAPGVGVGTAIAGPIGGIVGGITASGLEVMIRKFASKHLPKDIHRNLSINEKERLRKVLSHFNTKIIQNLSEGRTIRQDSFFDEKLYERSAPEEILEGVLFAAEREYEEKKVKYVGILLANILIEPKIDRAFANFLLRLSERLSYRQLCILALFAQRDKFTLRDKDYRFEDDNNQWGTDFNNNLKFALLQDIYDLYSQNMLGIDGFAMVSAFDINASKMVIFGPAKALYFLKGLEEIDQSDIKPLSEQLMI